MNTITASLKQAFGNASALLVVWVAAMLAMPIAQWGMGHQGLISGVILGVILQAALVVLFLAQATSARRAIGIVTTVAVLAWAAEALGSRTGIPFGAYHYTDKLQPQLLGVPLLIPLAWLMMLPPAWAVAQRITGKIAGPAFIVVSALAFTAWDLYLDPQMVKWGLWVWHAPGAYFGIPLVNFAGWLLVSAPDHRPRPAARPARSSRCWSSTRSPGSSRRGAGGVLGVVRACAVRFRRHGRVRGAGVAEKGGGVGYSVFRIRYSVFRIPYSLIR